MITRRQVLTTAAGLATGAAMSPLNALSPVVPTPGMELLDIPERAPQIEGWFRIELLGHRRLWGHIQELVMGSHSLLQADVLTREGRERLYLGPGAVYCLTAIAEDEAWREFGRAHGHRAWSDRESEEEGAELELEIDDDEGAPF